MIQIKFFFCRHPRNWGIGRGLKRGSQDSLCVYSLACCAITRSTTHTHKKREKTSWTSAKRWPSDSRYPWVSSTSPNGLPFHLNGPSCPCANLFSRCNDILLMHACQRLHAQPSLSACVISRFRPFPRVRRSKTRFCFPSKFLALFKFPVFLFLRARLISVFYFHMQGRVWKFIIIFYFIYIYIFFFLFTDGRMNWFILATWSLCVALPKITA